MGVGRIRRSRHPTIYCYQSCAAIPVTSRTLSHCCEYSLECGAKIPGGATLGRATMGVGRIRRSRHPTIYGYQTCAAIPVTSRTLSHCCEYSLEYGAKIPGGATLGRATIGVGRIRRSRHPTIYGYQTCAAIPVTSRTLSHCCEYSLECGAKIPGGATLGRATIGVGRIRRSRHPTIYGYQTCAAIPVTSRTLSHCCCSLRLFPSSVEAKPHCGLKQI